MVSSRNTLRITRETHSTGKCRVKRKLWEYPGYSVGRCELEISTIYHTLGETRLLAHWIKECDQLC